MAELATERFDVVVEAAKKAFEAVSRLHRWEQEIALDIANSMRAHYWVSLPEDERDRRSLEPILVPGDR